MKTQIRLRKSVKNKRSKKEYTKDDCIEDLRELNNKLRNKLKELNSRMERILESVKYKLLLDHKEKLSKPKYTIEQRKKAADAEIENLKKLLELCKIEEEELSIKVEEAADFEQINEVKLLVEKEKQNQEVLKKTIRELQKEGNDNGKTLQRLNSNTNQYESFVDLNLR